MTAISFEQVALVDELEIAELWARIERLTLRPEMDDDQEREMRAIDVLVEVKELVHEALTASSWASAAATQEEEGMWQTHRRSYFSRRGLAGVGSDTVDEDAYLLQIDSWIRAINESCRRLTGDVDALEAAL